jgi:hypothetical protein
MMARILINFTDVSEERTLLAWLTLRLLKLEAYASEISTRLCGVTFQTLVLLVTTVRTSTWDLLAR